jgi:hypothetical protein
VVSAWVVVMAPAIGAAGLESLPPQRLRQAAAYEAI